MVDDSNERPIDSRPAARPKPKHQPELEPEQKTNENNVVSSSAAPKPKNPEFKINLWSINVSIWNLFWIFFMLNMGFGVIEQQYPLGGMNITYNTCSFGELDGSCSDTSGSRVLYIGLALVLVYVFVMGILKRIKRGY